MRGVDPALRTLVLLATHLSMLAAGVGLTLITLRGRRQAVLADRRALDVRATFLGYQPNRPRRPGRHRAPAATAMFKTLLPQRLPSLTACTLREAQAVMSTLAARRVQERREFVDLMTAAVGPARIRAHFVGRQYADARVA